MLQKDEVRGDLTRGATNRISRIYCNDFLISIMKVLQTLPLSTLIFNTFYRDPSSAITPMEALTLPCRDFSQLVINVICTEISNRFTRP